MTLLIRSITTESVFGLYGNDENSASFGLGWVLEKSHNYRGLVVKEIFGEVLDVNEVTISLQKHSVEGGFTDVELNSANRFHAVLEAKRSWNLPTEEQLRRYLPRLTSGTADFKRLVSISAAHREYALRHLPGSLEGVPLTHLAWGDLLRLAKDARHSAASYQEKLWLEQFCQHLQEFVSMDRTKDNSVFVVSLSNALMVEGNAHTWIDVVEIDQSYFHPVGGGWPVDPPNYIGFRYHGRLQSVHHIKKFEVIENVADVNPLWFPTDSDHFVYRLGPGMRPPREMRTGNIFRNGRVWCAIDTLLSGAFNTISDARDETKRRLEENT